MIPVRQTRFSIETIGNCYEACIASILEIPLSAVPDKATYVDADAFADRITQVRRAGGEKALAELDAPAEFELWNRDVDEWLQIHGLGRLEIPVEKRRDREEILDRVASDHRGYWIGIHENELAEHGWSHAVVHRGRPVVWDPSLGAEGELGPLIGIHLLTASDPPRIVRRLGPELLPDIEAALRDAGVELAWVPAA